ncbi:MAG: glycoside hydrolase family 99-like domain-containing protein [Kineosporiaceae bacterium]|nr:glycoside hydrolase family 99-like domain-containing protein [Aeromicrobium sp.]
MRRYSVAGAKRRAGRAFIKAAEVLGVGSRVVAPETFHAGFENWTRRRTARLKSDYPAQWRSALWAAGRDAPRVAVVFHVYYLELVPEILDGLAHIPVAFDLIVTNSSGVPLNLDTSHLDRLANTIVLDIPNHGRDILPLGSVINTDLLAPYELILKVHTKQSAWRHDHPDLDGSGEAWREDFVSALLGSQENVRDILGAFATDPALGVLTADGNVLGSEFWGGDRLIVDHLLRRLQLDPVDDKLQFASGSMYWTRGFILQGLRALDLSPEDFEPELGQVDGTTAHAIERIIGILTEEAGYDTRERSASTIEVIPTDAWERFTPDSCPMKRGRVIPFYLPQFHRFDENDSWWGTGFTEWSNVAAGAPVFWGHNQPLLPADLGFYDLTSDDVRAAQWDLASRAGLDGFMYYYYWFAGKKLMNTPIESLLASDSPTPFCIMWANENFTRRWDGGEKNILIGQDYDKAPATGFIHDVLPLISDERYLRIDGKPVIAVYRVAQIPDFMDVLAYWRHVAEEAGLGGLHLVTVDVGETMQGVSGDPSEFGLDAYLGFAPHNMKWTAKDRGNLRVDERFEGNIMSYGAMVAHAEQVLREPVADWRYPGVMINFDNTARRQWMPDLWYGSNPYTFRRWLDSALASVADRDFDQRVVFVNAWNEWAESAVLEPSQRFGSTFLLATRDALWR